MQNHAIPTPNDSLAPVIAGPARAVPRLSIAALLAAREAKKANGPWVPACGGTETPFTSRSGKVLLYCYQATTGRHAYLDCGTDLILTDEEARAALMLY
jgi:hypothetical protein